MNNISNELEATIQVLVLQNRKIEAIKIVRDTTGCSLKEAKDFIDTFPDDPQQMPLGVTSFADKTPANIDEQLLLLLGQGKKLEAIKLYKDTTGNDLAQCKAYIDDLEDAAQAYVDNPAAAKGGRSPKRDTQIDDLLQQQPNSKSKSGCFIATVCYGDHDAPEVWLLRQYRDERLLITAHGRVFVQLYYAISPFLANGLKHHPTAKNMITRFVLAPLISKLLR